MDDCISRHAAIELCDWYEHEFCECDYAIRALADDLESLPTAERKKGKWIPVTNGRGGHECDQCHEYAPSWQTGEEHLTDYCPKCGADMRGEE